MPDNSILLAFALVSLGLALTPGPNTIYVVSRSLSQGRGAGFISLAGVAIGFLAYMLSAAFGITAILLAVPIAYDALRLGGAAYLLWLAWQMLRPGGSSPFEPRSLPVDGPRRLFVMGLLTNLLNPKIAMFYLAFLPQFIDPSHGSILAQSIVLGAIQIALSMGVNAVWVVTAGAVAAFLKGRPAWLLAQRWLMGTMLTALAIRLATEAKR